MPRAWRCVLFLLLREQASQKQEKLAQFAERVWHSGREDRVLRIEEAIIRTEQFFQQMGWAPASPTTGLDARVRDLLQPQTLRPDGPPGAAGHRPDKGGQDPFTAFQGQHPAIIVASGSFHALITVAGQRKRKRPDSGQYADQLRIH